MSFRLNDTWSLSSKSIDYDDVVIAAGPSPDWFYSTWNTSNTSTGSSTATQIKLPLVSTGTYNFVVDWGDGTTEETITTWNQAQTTHTYATAGTYIIRITGTITGWQFNDTGDKLKLLSIQQWGTLRPGNNTAVFMGCANLKLDNVRGILNTTGMTSFYQLFHSCTSLVQVNRINEWNTSSITNMVSTFDSCYLFNDNIGNWNTFYVTDISGMFAFAGAFNNGGSPDINNWYTANVINMSNTFNAGGFNGPTGGFNQYIGDWNTSKVTTMQSMFQNQREFNQDISTKVATKTVFEPTPNGIVKYIVTYTAWDTKNVTNMATLFQTSSTGFYSKFNKNIGNWNTSKVTNMSRMFNDANDFNQNISTKAVTVNGATYTAWDTKEVTDMGLMFSSQTSRLGVFNQNIGNWNTSKVTSMIGTFQCQPLFNQDISTKAVTVNAVTYTAWDTKEVTNMGAILGAGVGAGVGGKFNQNIGNWNTSKVTAMNSMFSKQPLFNQDVGTKVVTVNGVTYTAWNVENVTDMSFMFNSFLSTADSFGVFNNGGSDSIKNWNTSKVTTLLAFCQRQAFFNQNIGTKAVTVNGVTYTAWDTKEVNSMNNAFSCSSTVQSGSFNNGASNDIKDWNTSKVTTMQSMFSGQPLFNQNIGTKASTVNGVTYTAWDTLNVTNMSYMLNAYVAGNINGGVFTNGGSASFGNWNTSKVTNMSFMFQDQVLFNQTINTMLATINGVTYTAWDTLNVTNMAGVFAVFNKTGIFNQTLGNWNTSKVTNMGSMFSGQILFNKNIGTRQVTVGASTYNSWDTLNVTDMSFMFNANPLSSNSQGVFNNGGQTALSNWNTSKVTTLRGMFQNQPLFNQNPRTKSVTVGASTYTAWDTLNVTNMRYMFFNKLGNTTSQFNQNIGNWNTAKVTDMTAMFYNAAAFNQNLNSWNVSFVTAFNSPTALAETFADGAGLSTVNYDNLLEGWSLRPVLANKTISFGTTKYSAAAALERAILTSPPNNWTIIDGGQL